MTFDYDPERALWKPGRRKFFLGLGAFFAAGTLPLSFTDPDQICLARDAVPSDAAEFGWEMRYYWVDSRTGERKLIPQFPTPFPISGYGHFDLIEHGIFPKSSFL